MTATEALARLRALNEARTKGEWCAPSTSDGDVWDTKDNGDPGIPLMRSERGNYRSWGRSLDDDERMANAAAIVAAMNALSPLLDAAEALAECAEDLEIEVGTRWASPDGTIHPANQRKYDRDMEPVHKARAALSAIAKLEERHD